MGKAKNKEKAPAAKAPLRVNFVYEATVGNWSMPFAMLIARGLREQGIVVNEVNLTGLGMYSCVLAIDAAPECDVWYLGKHYEWMAQKCIDTGKPVVAHAHGGRETGAASDTIYGLDEPVDMGGIIRQLACLTVNTSSHSAQVSSFYGANNTSVIGFPLDFSIYKGYQSMWTDKTKIVVAGRLVPDKQPELLAVALAPFKRRVVFTTSESWSGVPSATYRHLKRLGYRVFTDCRDREYHQVLARSAVSVSATLADTLNLCVVESILSGATPVVPNIPVFDDYVGAERYDPYHIDQIRTLVENALIDPFRGTDGVQKYHWREVGKRLANVLRGVA